MSSPCDEPSPSHWKAAPVRLPVSVVWRTGSRAVHGAVVMTSVVSIDSPGGTVVAVGIPPIQRWTNRCSRGVTTSGRTDTTDPGSSTLGSGITGTADFDITIESRNVVPDGTGRHIEGVGRDEIAGDAEEAVTSGHRFGDRGTDRLTNVAAREVALIDRGRGLFVAVESTSRCSNVTEPLNGRCGSSPDYDATDTTFDETGTPALG